MTEWVYFLSGRDLEMLEIQKLLAGALVHDKSLPWGAKASSYRAELETELALGRSSVLVELEDDLALRSVPLIPHSTTQPLPKVPPEHAGVIVVDHHAGFERGHLPTSLEQSFFLRTGQWSSPDEGTPNAQAIALGWSRQHDLVAANDRGHVRAMLALSPPATEPEMLEIRAAERCVLGITPDEEAAASRAVEEREELADGLLTILHLPGDRVSAATDRMEPLLGGPGYRNLLIVSPNEYSFFGEPLIIERLDACFPGPFRGARFWGPERHGISIGALRSCILGTTE